MAGGGERTFLVETYVPRLDESIAAAIASRLRAAIGELTEDGAASTCIGSFALVGEETYLCFVAAPALEHVLRLIECAGIEVDHVAEVIALDAPMPSRA